jgi:hypothetical protein
MADGHPLVVVRIGHIRVEIGPLEYINENKLIENGGIAAYFLPRQKVAVAAILLSIIFALLTIITIIAAILSWRRRHFQGIEHEKSYKRIQLQMEQMESQVRKECKQVIFLNLKKIIINKIKLILILRHLLNFKQIYSLN